jgi:prolipoprotein diacylglyceryltransferase
MLGFYLIGYGTVRFFIEYFREPDAHLGFVFLHFSMGQLLCAAMILGGLGIYLFYRQLPPPEEPEPPADEPAPEKKSRARKSGRKPANRTR